MQGRYEKALFQLAKRAKQEAKAALANKILEKGDLQNQVLRKSRSIPSGGKNCWLIEESHYCRLLGKTESAHGRKNAISLTTKVSAVMAVKKR